MVSIEIPSHFTSADPVDVKSVEFLQQLAALVPGIIYVFNHQSMSNEYSNRSIASMLGYEPDEIKAMGDDLFSKIIHPDDFDRLAEHIGTLQDLQPGDKTVWEYRAICRDGTEVWLRSIEAVFTRSADGGVLRHVGIAFDVTAEKHAELHLRKLNAELEARVAQRMCALKELNDELEDRVNRRTRELRHANKELEQLSYIAAHDLKGPISAMAGLTDMLEEARDSLPAEHADTIGWMRTACRQASEKLDALAHVAQANAPSVDPFQPVPLAECITRVLQRLRPEIDDVDPIISIDVAQHDVFFLTSQVENILQELVSNAINYRTSDRRLAIDLHSIQTASGTTLKITDNGSGFDVATDLAKVFGLFQRVHLVPEGAGVALYTISRIVQQIGGRIEAESKKGVGSTFSVHFPAAPMLPST